jgi:AraC-like DNA-binding protein
LNLLVFLNEQHFNAYDLIIFTLVLQSAIFCILLLNRVDRHISHFSLAAFIASLGAGQFCFLLLYHPLFSGLLTQVFNDVGFALLTLVFYLQGFLLYFYIRTLMHTRFLFFLRDLAPFLVALILSLASALLWKSEWVSRLRLEEIFWKPFVLVSVVGFAVSVFYGIRSLFFIGRYSEQLKNHFSTLEHLDLFWLKAFTLGYVLIWTIQILPPFFYVWAPWWLQEIVTHSSALLSLIAMNFIFFKGLTHARTIKQIKPLLDEPLADDAVGTRVDDNQEVEKFKQMLDERIRSESLYSRPHLNIERLATTLGMSVRQLSNIINRDFGQNYFEFINNYRLAAVKERLRSPEWQEKSIQDIYESVGFSSKSSFFTLFRKQLGMTPVAYREQFKNSAGVDQVTGVASD